MATKTSSTNLKNRVNKLYLPRTTPLLPLFEVISNSIHSIDEIRKTDPNFKGDILVSPIRRGIPEVLADLPDIEPYPIISFSVKDNGIGLHKDNFESFREFDSEYKSKIGGKGIGRLVCLKAFNKLIVKSIFKEDDSYKFRNFEYKKSKEGFEGYDDGTSTEMKTGTSVVLSEMEPEYLKQSPLEILEIARQIISHFQLYFIQEMEPNIIIRDQNNIEKNLSTLYSQEFDKQILKDEFTINTTKFKVFISKSYKAKSHKIHYCAHQRNVKDEGLSKYNNDLRNIVRPSPEEPGYFYQVFIVSDYLDNNVNDERTGFNFLNEEDDDLKLIEGDADEISLAKIRNASLHSIENLLKDFFGESRNKKLEEYIPIIKNDFPNYFAVLHHNKEKVEKLPAGLSKKDLDLRLYEIEADWKFKVKEQAKAIIDPKKDVTNMDEYKKSYDKFITEFNEIGQSDLARYVVHRRSVIQLLERLWEINSDNKFADEEIIHSLFFPIRETAETVPHEKQNLWLLDERLTFNSLLASDKLFKNINEIESDSSDRMDLIVKKDETYDKAALFAEKKHPFESFTVLEFKKPNRNDYVYGDAKKDPVRQVRKYIEEIIGKKVKVGGRTVEAKKNTPFYCYIVADITETLAYILKQESFNLTPDGDGQFRMYETVDSIAYVEVLPFMKVVKDAKQRNKILFDKINLSVTF